MQIAVISDIHGECFPLDSVLRDIRKQGVEQIVCLGDALQGGSQPAQTLARLRELQCPVVMGNADDWLITGEDISSHEQVSEKQREVRAWSLTQLAQEDIVYIQQFSPTVEIPLMDGKKMLCFHGSPHSFNDIILPETPDETVRQFLSGFEALLFTGGHTHTQQLRRLGSAWYFNPGSVSLAYNWGHSDLTKGTIRVDPWADYAIVSYDGTSFGITFRHVPYNVDELTRIVHASGRPYAAESVAIYQCED